MEEDIAPGLFKSIQTDFQSSLTKNRKIAAVQKKLDEGIATVQDCNSYAEEVGNALADAYKKNISSDNLPNGRLYYNIAERTIRPTMENNYELISDVTMQTLDEINRAAGIGLKAQKAELNEDRIRKLINIVTDAGHYDDVAGFLADPVVNFSRNVVDSTVQKNADFQYKAGLDTKVVRTLNGEKTCEWCQSKAGTYDYEDVKDTGNPVWQRHENCDCTIEYVTRKGRQTVFNYREDNTPEARARRKAIKNELQDDMNPDRIKKRIEIALNTKYEKDIIIPGSVGAKFRDVPVDMPDGTEAILTPHSRIEKVETIAGMGRNRKIDAIDILIDVYKSTADSPELWKKQKGMGFIDYEGETRKVDLHWYSHPKTGNVEYKIKPDQGGNWFYDD